MHILHLNTYEANGGAGKAAERLNQALVSGGVQSRLGVNFSFVKPPRAESFSSSPASKAWAMFCMLSEQLYTKRLVKQTGIPFSTSLFGRDLSRHPWVRQADLLHIHWINQGFLSLSNLEALFKLGKPVVYTFHDAYPFTGGCHVRYDCQRYTASCGNCPVLLDAGENDESRKNWTRKQGVYRQNPFAAIAPSRWMRDRASESPLLEGHSLHHIPNCLDTRIFVPLKKTKIRQQMGIDENDFVILAGFMPSRSARHKGAEYLWKALSLISRSPHAQRCLVLFIGNKTGSKAEPVPETGLRMRMLGVLDSDERLARAYASADVFLSASLEESLGYTAIESLACGTPVVAFHTSGLLDVVDHRANGYLAELASAEDLAAGLEWIAAHPDKTSLAAAAREKAVSHFSMQTVALAHEKLYTQMLRPKNE